MARDMIGVPIGMDYHYVQQLVLGQKHSQVCWQYVPDYCSSWDPNTRGWVYRLFLYH